MFVIRSHGVSKFDRGVIVREAADATPATDLDHVAIRRILEPGTIPNIRLLNRLVPVVGSIGTKMPLSPPVSHSKSLLYNQHFVGLGIVSKFPLIHHGHLLNMASY